MILKYRLSAWIYFLRAPPIKKLNFEYFSVLVFLINTFNLPNNCYGVNNTRWTAANTV